MLIFCEHLVFYSGVWYNKNKKVRSDSYVKENFRS